MKSLRRSLATLRRLVQPLSRFEKRILGTIAAVGIVPFLGSIVFGYFAVREAYHVGVNPRVVRDLDRATAVYRDHLALMRVQAEAEASVIRSDPDLYSAATRRDWAAVRARLTEQIEASERIGALRLLDVQTREELAEVVRTRAATERFRERTIEQPLVSALRPGHELPVVLSITILAPQELFDNYAELGETAEIYRRLQHGSEYVSRFYLMVYLSFLGLVVLISFVIGTMLSRRVTYRVALLSEAAEKIGAGDLSVRIRADSQDELGYLTRRFNRMISDLGDLHDRNVYLERIGAWQDVARQLAHEIKNPLTPIQLSVQQACGAYHGDDPQYRRLLDETRAIVEEEVETLRRLVSEFSAFAKLPTVRLQEHDLTKFLLDLQPSWRATLVEREAKGTAPHVELHFSTPAEPLRVRIDATLLKRCLDNLIQNAFDAIDGAHQGSSASPAASSHSTATKAHELVLVAASRHGEHVRIEVRDSGPGVPDELRQRIFDPYITSRASGTGLGLAIAKKIVLEHGGRIEVARAPEGGACFRITIRPEA